MVVKGTKEDLAKHYGDFVLNYLSTNLESRKPYINTNPEFYPDILKQVFTRLKKYNMKIGLWFNPIVAARSIEMLKKLIL